MQKIFHTKPSIYSVRKRDETPVVMRVKFAEWRIALVSLSRTGKRRRASNEVSRSTPRPLTHGAINNKKVSTLPRDSDDANVNDSNDAKQSVCHTCTYITF